MAGIFLGKYSVHQLKENTVLLQSQGNVPCCTASAVLTSMEILGRLSNKSYNFSRLFLYYNTRKLQNRIGQKGANLLFTLEALRTFGCAEERYWPFMYQRVDREPTLIAYKNAEQYKSIVYKSLGETNFREFIDNRIPVVIGMNIGRAFYKLAGRLDEQVYFPINETTNRFSRGHALVIVGYDDSICGGSWIVANSVGLKWGDKGFGIIPYVCEPDISEAYVIEKFGNFDVLENIHN